MAGAVELARGDRQDRIAPREQPALRAALQPPGAQHSSSCGESIAWRSLRPLPCSTRISMRLLSMSQTLQHHDLAGPEPRAIGDAQSAALYLRPGPGAASSRRATSSGDSTRGSLRG